MKKMYELIKEDLEQEKYSWREFFKYCVFQGIVAVALMYIVCHI